MKTKIKLKRISYLLIIILFLFFSFSMNSYATDNPGTEGGNSEVSGSSSIGNAFENSGDTEITVNVKGEKGKAAAEELEKVLTNDDKTGLMDIVTGAGAVIITLGIGKLFFAFKDDNAGEKSQATMILLAGIFLLALSTILKNVTTLDFL